MKQRTVLAVGVAIVVGVLAVATDGLGAPKKTPSQKSELYSVIQIGDELKVIPKSGLNDEKKRLQEQYKQDLKAYEEAKKSAGKNKDSAEVVKPDKRNYTIKVLKSTFKSQQEAEDYKEKHAQGADDSKAGKKNGCPIAGRR